MGKEVDTCSDHPKVSSPAAEAEGGDTQLPVDSPAGSPIAIQPPPIYTVTALKGGGGAMLLLVVCQSLLQSDRVLSSLVVRSQGPR